MQYGRLSKEVRMLVLVDMHMNNCVTMQYTVSETVNRTTTLIKSNSFNKTEAAVFSCRLCFLRAFPFISLIYLTTLKTNINT